MRLVQVRGASGSGKTTLVRSIMADLGRPARWFVPGRKKPIALTFENKGGPPLCVIGHYDVGCGGCDTIKSKEGPYQTAEKALSEGFNVLMEGLFLAVEFHRTVALQAAGVDRHDVFMDIPMAHCVVSVNARRVAEGKEPREAKQMEAFHRRIMQTYHRLNNVAMPNLYVFSEPSPDTTRALAERKVRELLEV